jgi:hypothetical protein
MTLEGTTKDEGALEGTIETTKDKGASKFKGGLEHVAKVKVVVILGLESSESKGLQAPLRGDLDPFDELKDGGYIFEFDTNNKGKDNLGF